MLLWLVQMNHYAECKFCSNESRRVELQTLSHKCDFQQKSISFTQIKLPPMPQKLSQGWVQIIAAEGPVVVWVGNTEHLWDGSDTNQ